MTISTIAPRGRLQLRFLWRTIGFLLLATVLGGFVGQMLRDRIPVIAMLISFFVTLLYLAWRFDVRLGAASVLANLHDIIATFALRVISNLFKEEV